MLDPVMVGKVIQQFREDRGVSQEVLSGLAGIGRTHLSSIERGVRRPTLETFFRIAEALQIKPSTMMAEIEKTVEKNSCIDQNKDCRRDTGLIKTDNNTQEDVI